MLTATSPICATVRGERRPAIRGPSSAKTSIATDSGSRRLPVSNASKPSTTCRYTGMTKNVPIRTSCCPTSVESPARSCAMRSSVVSSSWSRPRRARRCSQATNAHEQREPAEHHERHRREAQRRDLRAVDRRRRARLDEAPHAAAQDREHDQAQAGSTESATPTTSSCGRRSAAGRPRDLSAQEQDDDHDHGLGGEHVAPRELGRHPAADQRAGGDRDGGDPAEQRVGQRALAALVGGGGERRDRGHHEHRAEPLDPRPADQQDGEVRAQRRRQRPDP